MWLPFCSQPLLNHTSPASNSIIQTPPFLQEASSNHIRNSRTPTASYLHRVVVRVAGHHGSSMQISRQHKRIAQDPAHDGRGFRLLAIATHMPHPVIVEPIRKVPVQVNSGRVVTSHVVGWRFAASFLEWGMENREEKLGSIFMAEGKTRRYQTVTINEANDKKEISRRERAWELNCH